MVFFLKKRGDSFFDSIRLAQDRKTNDGRFNTL